MAEGQQHAALERARQLVQEVPHFQLAQLVYGDLLNMSVRPVTALGDVVPEMEKAAGEALADLREESRRRVKAQHDRPAAGTFPSQFVELAGKTRHAIAVDASRSRLYLFENRADGLTLLADYYVSVGKSGTSKAFQGDMRTPLGVYFITSRLE
ncbi:MAG: L,D-transpeptidase family protein, partial [Rhodoferax sp.]